MIQAGPLDMRYPCDMIHQILSTEWVRFLGNAAPPADAKKLVPGLHAVVIKRLKECNSARVSAADTEAITPYRASCRTHQPICHHYRFGLQQFTGVYCQGLSTASDMFSDMFSGTSMVQVSSSFAQEAGTNASGILRHVFTLSKPLRVGSERLLCMNAAKCRCRLSQPPIAEKTNLASL